MRLLRRLLAITLLVVFSLPLASPLFALNRKSEDNLPACCRRNGKHHCMAAAAAMTDQAKSNAPQFLSQPERCPYLPCITSSVRSNWATPPLNEMIFAGLVSHPAAIAQTQSKWRISRDRSRQKRGPPAFSL